MVDDPTLSEDIQVLKSRVEMAQLPVDLKEKVDQMLRRFSQAAKYSSVFEEYERVSHYIDWLTRLPWNTYTVDNLDIKNAKAVLDQHHYGLEDVKERLLEYLTVLTLNKNKGDNNHIARAPILLMVGLVGTGKTTFAYSLAEAMNRKIVRIPFGSMGSALDLRGQSRLHLEAEPGYVIKAMARAGTKNPIILLDEIDRVTENARNDIMGVLVELLDPEQNHSFLDHYLDYPFDMSQTLFIGTANGTSHIATAVMDRMEPISMPSYSDQEKSVIAQRYLLPKIIKETALPDGILTFSEDVWPQLVRPLGYDAGIRTLQRTLQGVVRKVAKEYLDGKLQSIELKAENIKPFLPSYKTEII
jgi:ATP-dependent Lon protease